MYLSLLILLYGEFKRHGLLPLVAAAQEGQVINHRVSIDIRVCWSIDSWQLLKILNFVQLQATYFLVNPYTFTFA